MTGQVGSLKCTHHFGLLRFATLREQLILQDSVTHSIKELPLLPLAFVLGAAAFAAGDKFAGTTCFGLKLFLFTPSAMAEGHGVGVDVSRMHENKNLPAQQFHDMTFVFSSAD